MKIFCSIIVLWTVLIFSSIGMKGQNSIVLSNEIAEKLSELPLKCINIEYPNKTAHIINDDNDAVLKPHELHPSFYGCFDWHSSVHGHWMLVRLLKIKPHLSNRNAIIRVLNNSFDSVKVLSEASYFTKYNASTTFERTYGWAWLLKLDEELLTWDDPQAKKWHNNLQPLTDEIVRLWKNYLPKQTYPNRTGVHPNSAFALGFAIDWARAINDTDFEHELIKKSKQFYQNDVNTPAYLEPDGSDFFSPSLQIADLMRRVLSKNEFSLWIKKFYNKKSLDNVCKIPIVSDLNDYQIVHLIGLSFSKVWCMNDIVAYLPRKHPLSLKFKTASDALLKNALPFVFQGNYGGDHWLASFAIMAME